MPTPPGQGRNEIDQSSEFNFVVPAEKPHSDYNAEESPVKGHATFPDPKDSQWIIEQRP